MTPETDALIAQAWPERWAWANDPAAPRKSRRRTKLRAQWKHHCALEALRAKHPEARCGTCKHHKPTPHSPDRLHCEVESDFYGYVLTAETNLCLHWKGNPCATPTP